MEEPDDEVSLKPMRTRSLHDGHGRYGQGTSRTSTPMTNLKPSGSGKLLFDMVRFPDHTFSLVPHDDVVYKRLRYAGSESNIYDRMKKVRFFEGFIRHLCDAHPRRAS
jgi:hypothetical protein